MLVYVTREHIVQALRNEPLRNFTPRHIVTAVSRDKAVGEQTECRVCAVGSVLRPLVDPMTWPDIFEDVIDSALSTEDDHNNGDLMGDPAEELRAQRWMHALSSFFEEKCIFLGIPTNGRITEEVREDCIQFVLTHFPEKIVLDIADAEPAPGIKRV